MSVKKLISRIRNGHRRNCIYHFTDEANLGGIRLYGGILSKQFLEDAGAQVPRPGGDQASRMSDQVLGNFGSISLCLTNNHPMAFRCRMDGRHPKQTYLQIDPEILELRPARVALGLANSPDTEIIPISEAFDRLDLDVLYSNPAWNPDTQRRLALAEKVEILFPRIVPGKYITGQCSPR